MEKTFETSLEELEQIVEKLEGGDLPLEESLELFEKGIKLSRECRTRLANAERRIEILTKDAEGNLVAADLEPENLRDAEATTGKRIVCRDDDDIPF
jgi:exodeoxyribonuclease VII small subunit